MLYFNDPAWASDTPWGSGSMMMTIPGTTRHVVWESDLSWANKIVWGNHMVGTVVDEKIVWGFVQGGATIAWGDLGPEGQTEGAKIVWSYIEGDSW
jgi:hypothetical protein